MATSKSVSLKGAFSFAWDSLIENIGEIFLAFIVSLLEIIGVIIGLALIGVATAISGGIAYLYDFLRYSSFFSHTLIMFFLFILGFLLTGCVYYIYHIRLIRMGLDIYDREETSSSSWWPLHSLLFLVVPAFFVYALSLSIGMLFLIFPGLYIFVTWGLFDYIIVDKKVGFITAFKESAHLTKGIKIKLIGFFIMCYLITLIPLLGFLLGVPFCTLAKTYVYRQLQEQS